MQNLQVNKKEIALKSLFGMIAILFTFFLFYLLYTDIWYSFDTREIQEQENKFGMAIDGILGFMIFFMICPIILPFFYLLSFIILYYSRKINKQIENFILSFFIISVACLFLYFPTSIFFMEIGRTISNEQIGVKNPFVSICDLYAILFYYFVWFKFVHQKFFI